MQDNAGAVNRILCATIGVQNLYAENPQVPNEAIISHA
jgi:hypothetical protein